MQKRRIGFLNFKRNEDTGRMQNLKDSIFFAESDALREACHKFRMGWVDLSPYSNWAKNPTLELKDVPTSRQITRTNII